MFQGFPGGSADKESACSAGDLGLIPGLGRSPGEGKGYPLQYSGLENSMDCTVHKVTRSRIWLGNFHITSLQTLYLWMCSSVYQPPSSGFSTSVIFFFFLFKCHRHLLCSDFYIQENIFIFMPYWNLQCISDKAVKCDNKNLIMKKKKKPVSYGKYQLGFFGLFRLFLILCFTPNNIYQSCLWMLVISHIYMSPH